MFKAVGGEGKGKASGQHIFNDVRRQKGERQITTDIRGVDFFLGGNLVDAGGLAGF